MSIFLLCEVVGCSSKSSLNSKIWYNKQNCVYGINPLTCTIFDPVFLAILREIKFFTFPQQDANRPLWVTTSTLSLKWHTGLTQALIGARENWFVCLDSEFVHGIFNTVEYPALLKNSDVTNIFTEFMN